MKALPCFLLAASLLIGASAYADDGKDAADARAATEHWMKLMDSEEYSAAWKSSAEGVRKGMPKLAWTMLNSALHSPLGTLKSRTFQTFNTQVGTPGKPTTVTLSYLADYENSHKVREQYTAVHETDGVWRVSGYTINSEDGKTAK